MNVNEGASPAIEGEVSVWTEKRTVVLSRIASACTGGVSQNRAGWESYRTRNVGGLTRVLHHSLAAPPSKGRLA